MGQNPGKWENLQRYARYDCDSAFKEETDPQRIQSSRLCRKTKIADVLPKQ